MRIFSLFWLEFRRLLRSPLTWLIMGLTVLSPVMGLFLYQPTEATTLGTYLANPSLAAAKQQMTRPYISKNKFLHSQ